MRRWRWPPEKDALANPPAVFGVLRAKKVLAARRARDRAVQDTIDTRHDRTGYRDRQEEILTTVS